MNINMFLKQETSTQTNNQVEQEKINIKAMILTLIILILTLLIGLFPFFISVDDKLKENESIKSIKIIMNEGNLITIIKELFQSIDFNIYKGLNDIIKYEAIIKIIAIISIEIVRAIVAIYITIKLIKSLLFVFNNIFLILILTICIMIYLLINKKGIFKEIIKFIKKIILIIYKTLKLILKLSLSGVSYKNSINNDSIKNLIKDFDLEETKNQFNLIIGLIKNFKSNKAVGNNVIYIEEETQINGFFNKIRLIYNKIKNNLTIFNLI